MPMGAPIGGGAVRGGGTTPAGPGRGGPPILGGPPICGGPPNGGPPARCGPPICGGPGIGTLPGGPPGAPPTPMRAICALSGATPLGACCMGGPDCGPPGAWYGCWNPCGAPAICGGPLICGRPPLVCGVPPMFGGPALGIMGLGAKCGGAPPAKPVCFREVDRVRSRWGRAVGQIRQATEMCAHVRCPLVVEGFLGRMMFAHMGLGRSNPSPNGE